MDLNRAHFRAMIFYDFRSGLNQHECLQRLSTAFPDQAPSRTTVFDWYAEFRRGRRSLEDEDRSGRPPSATNDEQVSAVEAMVKEDARVTVAQIGREVGISSGSIITILHEKLRCRKVCARWVPHIPG